MSKVKEKFLTLDNVREGKIFRVQKGIDYEKKVMAKTYIRPKKTAIQLFPFFFVK